MPEIHLSVAICTRNRAAILAECIGSIMKSCRQLTFPWEVIVVDNGSTDRTPEVLRGLSADPHLRVVREERMGISRARNAAVANALGKVLAFVDDDLIVREDWATMICSEFDAQGVDLLGGLMLGKWEKRPPWWLARDQQLYGVLGLLESRQLVDGRGYPRVFSGNCALRRWMLLDLGDTPFDPRLGRVGTRLTSGEEAFLFDLLWQRGAKVGFSEKVIAYHRVPASRATLRYFMKWHFQGGTSDFHYHEARASAGAPRLPRWVLGELMRRGIEVPLYLFTGKPRRSVTSMFSFLFRLGRVFEYARMHLRG